MSPLFPTAGSLEPVLEGLQRGDLKALATAWRNGLSAPARRLCPSVQQVESLQLEAGAMGTLLCGSGPTVLGLYCGAKEAARAAAQLRDQGLWAEAVRSYQPAEDE
jgi:4-diphosphocytidyl-2-C-methyl-D-erythritol kinase